MPKLLMGVNSLTIQVPAHNKQPSTTTTTGPLATTSVIKIGQDKFLVQDGDSGNFTCPICGGTFKYTISGNTPIKIGQDHVACMSGANYAIEHGCTLISADEQESAIQIGQ